MIGLDEAGYGPNLGPLVISSSCWFLYDYSSTDSPEEELRRRLRQCGAVCETLREKKTGQGIIAIGDSKTLYQSGDSLDLLRETVLSVLAQTQHHDTFRETTWRREEVLSQLFPNGAMSQKSETPWDRELESGTVSVDRETVVALSETFFRANVNCPFLFSRSFSPQEFNAGVRKWDSKATAHIHWVFELLRDTLDHAQRHAADVLRNSDCRFVVLCDKLGARNRYAPFLYSFFEEKMVQTLHESAEKSEYRFSSGGQNVEIAFHVRGERFVPVALASMTSKWIRELAMEAFNSFWCRQVPNLQPTAGYPVDAKRFLREIETMQKNLQIPDDVLWRYR